MRDRLLATGRYLSVVPDSVLHFAGDRLSFRPLPVKLPISPRPVAVVTLRNRTLSPVAQLFIDGARKLTKGLGRAAK
jgi:DNA-binding transcriptional LysR family regulator